MSRRCSLCKSETHDKRRCPFSVYQNYTLIALDWESKAGGKWNTAIWKKGQPIETGRWTSKLELLSENVFQEHQPYILIIESAHLVPRTTPPRSVAQVYDDHQQSLLSDVHNAPPERNLVKFPGTMTSKAKKIIGYESKDDDPAAIMGFFVEKCRVDALDIDWSEKPENRIALGLWKPVSQIPNRLDVIQYATQTRQEMSTRMDIVASSGYTPEDQDVLNLQRLVDTFPEFLENWQLDPNQQVPEGVDPTKAILEANHQKRESVHITRYGSDTPFHIFNYFGLKFSDGKMVLPKGTRKQKLLCMYITMFDFTGNIRRPFGERAIGFGMVWDRLLLQSPFHGGSGAVRAKLMLFGLRSYDKARFKERFSTEDLENMFPSGTPHLRYPESEPIREYHQQHRREWKAIQKRLYRLFLEASKQLEMEG